MSLKLKIYNIFGFKEFRFENTSVFHSWLLNLLNSISTVFFQTKPVGFRTVYDAKGWSINFVSLFIFCFFKNQKNSSKMNAIIKNISTHLIRNQRQLILQCSRFASDVKTIEEMTKKNKIVVFMKVNSSEIIGKSQNKLWN